MQEKEQVAYTLKVPAWQHLPISVDLETMGLGTDAPVFAIGAVRFTEDGSPLPEDCPGEFYQLINLQGQSPVEISALHFWLEQLPAARNELLLSKDAPLLHRALGNFSAWLLAGYLRVGLVGQTFEGALWARGDRDSAWLETLYKRCGYPLPYRYNKVGNQRTLLDFAERHLNLDVWLPRETVMHHALHDARYQAECLQQVFKRYPNLDHVVEPE